MNPNRYDTEHFTFDYDVDLTIKLKNQDSKCSGFIEAYLYGYGTNPEEPAYIVVNQIFTGDIKPPDVHIHKVGQFFTPWFKRETDCRSELGWGIRRFYALHSYNLLDKGLAQFDFALSAQRKIYNQILERMPALIESCRDMKQRLALNYQDKGVSTARGSTIFDTKERVWIMYETPIKNPESPEYLWSVSHFSPAFAPWTGSLIMARHLDDGNIAQAAWPNQKCFDAIMQAQKDLYGISPVDLDKIETDIRRLSSIIVQLELILDIPLPKTAVPDLDA